MKEKSRIKLKGFVKVRRGLVEHLSQMQSSEVKLFFAYLSQADFWDDGPAKKCLLTIKEMAKICGWSKQWTIEVKKKLIDRGFLLPLKRGVEIPKFDEKESANANFLGHENLTSKEKNTLPQESTAFDSKSQQNLTTEVKDTLPQNPASLSDSDACGLPKKCGEVKKCNKRQEAKNAPVLKSHQSQNSLDTPLNLTEKIQADWSKYWPDYRLINQKEIYLLLSKPLSEYDSPKFRVEFIREAIRQAAQYREEIGKKIDSPVTWIFSGLHRGSHWLRDRTINALEEKREAQIRAGHRGSKKDWKTMETIMDGVKECRSKKEKEITDSV